MSKKRGINMTPKLRYANNLMDIDKGKYPL